MQCLLDLLDKIRKVVFEFKTLEEEEKKLMVALLKINEEQTKLGESYIRIANRLHDNNTIIGLLDVDITNLKEIKYKIDHYEQFKSSKKRSRIMQAIIVTGVCGILASPLIGIDTLAYLELTLFNITLMGLSNSVKYFNEIRQRKELVKSTDIVRLNNSINKKERQRKIGEYMKTRLYIKSDDITKDIENLKKEKVNICDRLEYFNNYKTQLISELSKTLEQDVTEDASKVNQEIPVQDDSRIKLE